MPIGSGTDPLMNSMPPPGVTLEQWLEMLRRRQVAPTTSPLSEILSPSPVNSPPNDLAYAARLGKAIVPTPSRFNLFTEEGFGGAHPGIASAIEGGIMAGGMAGEGFAGGLQGIAKMMQMRAQQQAAQQAAAGQQMQTGLGLLEWMEKARMGRETADLNRRNIESQIQEREAPDFISASPGTTILDRRTGKPVYTSSPNVNWQMKTGMSGGKRVVAFFDPDSRRVTDANGQELTDFQPIESDRQGGINEQIIESIVGPLNDPNDPPEVRKRKAEDAIRLMNRLQPGMPVAITDDQGRITRYEYPKMGLTSGQAGAVEPTESGGRRSGLPPGTQERVRNYENSYRKIVELGKVFKPEFVGPFQGRLQASAAKGALSIIPGISPPEGYGDFAALSATLKNAVINLITGAAVGVQEEQRILGEIPVETDKDEIWAAKYNQTVKNAEFLLETIREQTGAAAVGGTRLPNTPQGGAPDLSNLSDEELEQRIRQLQGGQ